MKIFKLMDSAQGRWWHRIFVNGTSRDMKKHVTYVVWLMSVEQHSI